VSAVASHAEGTDRVLQTVTFVISAASEQEGSERSVTTRTLSIYLKMYSGRNKMPILSMNFLQEGSAPRPKRITQYDLLVADIKAEWARKPSDKQELFVKIGVAGDPKRTKKEIQGVFRRLRKVIVPPLSCWKTEEGIVISSSSKDMTSNRAPQASAKKR